MAKYKIIPSSRTIVQSPISIGHKAEKGVEAIEFDVTAWVETYGSGTLTVIMRRWGDAIPYPIALEIDENNKATWVLSDIDTAKAGMAYAQLSYIVGDEVVKKSDIYTFRVMDSLTGEGEPPEAYESWLEHLTHLAAEAMAEVLDIEGIVTDKTLTVDGGIADAKATGEALAAKVNAADYSELSARVGANTIALAEKADRATTYTKNEVDQMISDVEVETDTTLAVSGAPADAKKTGDELSALKADLGDVLTVTGKKYDASNLFTNVGYYINSLGGITASSSYSCSDYIPVREGDVIEYSLQVASNTVAIGFYESTSSLTGFVNIVSGTGSAITGAVTITDNGYIRVASVNTFVSSAYVTILGTVDELKDDIQEVSAGLAAVEDTVDDFDSFFDGIEVTTVTSTDITFTWITGSYYNLTNGTITPLSSYARTEKYPCTPGDVVVIPPNSGQIVFFKTDGTVSYKSSIKTYTIVRAVPADAIAFALNNNDSTVMASGVTHKSVKDAIRQIPVDSPAKVICDSDAFVVGEYANTSNGNISTGVANYYGLTNFPVQANHKYRTQTQTQVVFYDADMTFISASLPGGAAANTGTRVEMDFTTPANCVYISVNSLSPHEMLFDVGVVYKPEVIVALKKLNGKKVLCFGDSITGNYAFGDNIAYEVEKHTGGKTINCGFGGCRMELLTGESETAQITNPFAMCSIVDELAKPDSDATKWNTQDAAAETFEASPRFNRIIKFRLGILKTVDITDVDIVTIAYGTNEIGYVQENAEDKYDKYTFGGATRYSIEKLLELNPKLQVVLLTPIYRHDVSSTGLDSDHYVSSHGLSMADNINTLKAVGLEYKMPVVDMYHDLGINAQNYLSYFGDDDEPDDGTHINTYGRKRYGERLAGELNRLF